MKTILAILRAAIFLLLVDSGSLTAQTTSFAEKTNAGKPGEQVEVIFSVDPKNNKINNIFLREGSAEQQLYQLKQHCYRCLYYTGNLEGTFDIKGNYIVPRKGAAIIIYPGIDLMTEEKFNPRGSFKPGSVFPLSGVKTTVVSNQQGVVILKAI